MVLFLKIVFIKREGILEFLVFDFGFNQVVLFSYVVIKFYLVGYKCINFFGFVLVSKIIMRNRNNLCDRYSRVFYIQEKFKKW